jgi:DNA-binding transcriptional LysR family regulator
MTLNQLKYFLAVARCLSFTEAARSLFMTQPALSRQIQAMETELGTQLFVRDKKTLKLTPGGSVLYSGLPEFLKEYDEMMAEVRHANRGFEGTLRIGILDVYDASELLHPVVDRFQHEHPGIRLTMERFSLGELPERLYEGRLDLVCTYGFSLFDKPDLMTVNVQKFDSCVMLNRKHPLAHKPDLTLDDLRQDRFVQLCSEASEDGYQYISNLISRGGIDPEVMYVEKNDDVLLWVEMGGAVAITSNCTIERHNPRVVVRELNMPEVKGHDITMGWRKSNYNPAIALFMELMEGHR